MEQATHKSVMTQEVLHYLNITPHKTYLDVTFGGGGHTRSILHAEPTCKVIALDWDKKTIETNAPALQKTYGNRFTILWGNFAHLYRVLKKAHIEKVDGILADFGTSQIQIQHTPGISFRKNTPLDMRISKAHYYFTAADVVNRFSEKELAKIFFELGEEKHARKIAHAIIESRKIEKFETTGQLAQLIEHVVPKHKKMHKKYVIHPATKIFQALRIFVNKELENIETFLSQTIPFLHQKARIICISFHSLEDRIVKTFFKKQKHTLSIITPKPLIPTEKEILSNPSSRSAKMRVAEKI
jgi:16S rRNA (cytosine1402-N4)-methyltransferase